MYFFSLEPTLFVVVCTKTVSFSQRTTNTNGLLSLSGYRRYTGSDLQGPSGGGAAAAAARGRGKAALPLAFAKKKMPLDFHRQCSRIQTYGGGGPIIGSADISW